MKVRLAGALSLMLGVGLAVFSAFSFWPGSAHATMYTIPVTVNEAQALSTCNPNPPPANGGGSGTVMYDSNTNMLSWNVSYSNLSGPVTFAHFHGPAGPGTDAIIQVTMPVSASPLVGNATITEPQEADLLRGNWYINIHTAACSSGEIRGQVSGGGVGGVTQLTNPAIAPLHATPQSSGNGGMIAGLAAAIAAVSLAGAGSALLVARRLLR